MMRLDRDPVVMVRMDQALPAEYHGPASESR
jgi:hypothetical protein